VVRADGSGDSWMWASDANCVFRAATTGIGCDMDRGVHLRDRLPADDSVSEPVADLRVLIVDDHPSFRSIAGRMLTGGGFTVVGEAADGAGALLAALHLRPDVVLLDIGLPDTDGFRVAEALAGQPDPPAVVLMSSRASADYGPVVGRSPVAGFISKADLSGSAVRRLLG